jgi:aldehyde dehydrogenase (NAD+)
VQAAAAQNVVPVTLELGGKSPQLVFADADLDKALPFLVNAGLQNAGQTCSASSRILVERSRLEEVADRMADAYRTKVAAPAMEDRDLGPLISARQKEIVTGYLDLAGQGQRIAEGQIAPDAPDHGHYVAPTLLAGIAPEDRLAQEEIFGPVQVLIPFDDEDHAAAIANGTPYGLVASVWSGDGGRQMRLARRLGRGRCFSTTTVRRGEWNCPSAARAFPVTGGKRGSRRFSPSPA